jgi:2-polyprenyl-3-methyl-5-hydroxy-6-metoxy-1,4-benzoquinol methylase
MLETTPVRKSSRSVDATQAGSSSCPVCGATRGEVVSRDSNRRDNLSLSGAYVRCSGCGHLFLCPIPEPDELAGFYEQLWRDEAMTRASNGKSKVRRARALFTKVEYKLFKRSFERYAALHQFLPEVSKRFPRLLDMGCGEGTGLIGFVGRGWKLCGVDISPTAVETASQRIPSGEFVSGELAEAARQLGPFDLVRLDNVLEHVIDLSSVLRAAFEQLNPGGHLAVYVPHGESLSLRWFRTRSVSHWVPFHLHLFTRQSLKRVLESAGFKDIRMELIDPPTWWPLTMSQTLHPSRNLAKYGGAATESIHLRLAAMPFRFLSGLSNGEELIAFAQKP